MLLNMYYQYHNCSTNIEEQWKCHSTTLPLSLGPFATAQDPSLPCQWLPPMLLLLWEPPREEMPGSCSPAGLTAGAYINNFLHLDEPEVESCHALQPQKEMSGPISIF